MDSIREAKKISRKSKLITSKYLQIIIKLGIRWQYGRD